MPQTLRLHFVSVAAAASFVFITATHTKMTQSNVSSALTQAFSNSGFSERVNCTKLRKSAVTQIHGTDPDKRADLASHTDVVLCTGRGVFLKISRPKGAFRVEYAGELISAAEGYRREDDDNSVYRFYFSHQNTKCWCVYCL